MSIDALSLHVIKPNWSAPANVDAAFTLRTGGASRGAWGGVAGLNGLNLGAACGDDPVAVEANRQALARFIGAEPRWLNQVHGADVVDAELLRGPVAADASFTDRPGVACVVMVADCLPVLLADRQGRVVGAAHAGWRGLAGGVIQATVAAMRARLGEPEAELLAWLGPAIGSMVFEVGPEVRDAMRRSLPEADAAFVAGPGDRLLADIFALGRQALASCGIEHVGGGGECTVSDPARFYSFRRDRITGRHAAFVSLRASQ